MVEVAWTLNDGQKQSFPRLISRTERHVRQFAARKSMTEMASKHSYAVRWCRFHGQVRSLRWVKPQEPCYAKEEATSQDKSSRRVFTKEFREEAVQMLLDGHTAKSIVDRLGLSGTNILYRWKARQMQRSGPVASSLEARVRELGNRTASRRAGA